MRSREVAVLEVRRRMVVDPVVVEVCHKRSVVWYGSLGTNISTAARCLGQGIWVRGAMTLDDRATTRRKINERFSLVRFGTVTWYLQDCVSMDGNPHRFLPISSKSTPKAPFEASFIIHFSDSLHLSGRPSVALSIDVALYLFNSTPGNSHRAFRSCRTKASLTIDLFCYSLLSSLHCTTDLFPWTWKLAIPLDSKRVAVDGLVCSANRPFVVIMQL
jgi:hypothetical protein